MHKMTIYWFYLLGAIAFEIIGTTCIKFSDGFTKLPASIATLITYSISIYLLSLSVQKIDVSTAYAIWSGIGIVCITFIGMYLFKDQMDLMKATCITLILIGVIGLNLTEGH